MKKNLRAICLALAVLALPFFSFAQKHPLGNWYIYSGTVKLSPKWSWYHEVQYRNYNLLGDLEQLLLRTGIGYNLTENNNNLLLGYGYILADNYVPGTDMQKRSHEHRIFQQFITRHRAGRVYLQHRYRFEQRILSEDVKYRFRYALGANIGLNNKEMVDKTLYLSLYNEVFLHTTATVFDRNRLYGGMGYKLNDKLRVELGYMNQFFASSGRDQLNIASYLSL